MATIKKAATPVSAKKAAPAKKTTKPAAAPAKAPAAVKPIKTVFNKTSLVAHLAETWRRGSQGGEGRCRCAGSHHPGFGAQEGPGLVHAAGSAQGQRA
jgi:hypothetical protein